MYKRAFFTAVGLTFSGAYFILSGPTGDSTRAAGQLSNDPQVAALARQAIEGAPRWPLFIGLLAVAVMWMQPLIGWLRTRVSMMLPLAVIGVLFAGCAARSDIKTVEANQTAFLIPVSGDAAQQVQLQSIDFLKKRQLAVKQVVIPYEWKSTGGLFGATGDWYPTLRLAVVDRTLVTREWTKSAQTGTTTSDQAFGVESSESIDFKIGATCTAIITEEDAAAYLYYYGSKPLSEVMDQNVRGYIQQELFNEFGSRPLVQGQTDKRTIFQSVSTRLATNFKDKGITILSFGGSEGMTYTDPKIQAAINQNYAVQQQIIQAQAAATAQSYANVQLSQQQIMQAQAAGTAQGYANVQLVALANAQATATVIAGDAQAKIMQENGQILAQYPGLTGYTIAQKSNGQVPQFLVMGSGSQSGALPFSFLIEQGTPVPISTPH